MGNRGYGGNDLCVRRRTNMQPFQVTHRGWATIRRGDWKPRVKVINYLPIEKRRSKRLVPSVKIATIGPLRDASTQGSTTSFCPPRRGAILDILTAQMRCHSSTFISF
ncbi:hypothetical protein AMTR_s00017p00193750 [Amborella trichopoda]|uniref:Uncharacterized protein n=1 Tax=Amborella trichopoda TaxID=13333 RepID=W1PN81_AMBTC|nr:hypothetical protein AMTR_s00017p00193750 [Amborella trichopoda]